MRQLSSRAGPLLAALSIATALTTSTAAADEPPPPGPKKPCEAPECGGQSKEAVVQTPCEPPECGEPKKPRPPLVVAGDPDPEPRYPLPEPDTYWRDGAGPRLTFGRAITEGIADGFYGRFESEYFEARDILIGGALLGLEGWGGPDGGGGAIPISVYWGVRAPLFSGPKAPSLFLSVGLGFNCIIVDYVKEEAGFGLFAPFATGVAGFEIFPGGRVLFDARAEYRWQWAAPDRYQLRLGLSLAANSDWWDGRSGGP
jgi:hypothetical protein